MEQKPTEVKENIPMKSIEDARRNVEANFKGKEETLWISDSLNDSVGINMAIIGDCIIKKGYMPNGFEQKEGYKIYKYQKNE